jgi:predicted dehydrogenase
MVNAAIVGLGRWGQRLVDSVCAPPSNAIRFTHAAARTPESTRAFCAKNRLQFCDDIDAALADPSVDAIVLATPHSQHADQVVKAAGSRKHVFVEKPFTLDVASAIRAAEACRRAAVVLALGHNRRFLPAMAEVKRLVATGALGEILHVEGAFSGNFALGYRPGIWRATQEESPAGGMTAMGIHIIDAFIHLGGPIRSVRCESHRKVLAVDLDDTTSAWVRFENGATGYLSTLTATGRIVRVQVFGTKGWAHLLDHHILEICDIDGRVSRTEYPHTDIERCELESFAEAIAGKAQYPVPTAQVIHGIAVMEAATRSAAHDGERVPVHPTHGAQA